MELGAVRKRFEDAVEIFVGKVKTDQNVIAVIAYGSYSYDTVWEKSDVDMMLVIRDQKIANHEYCIAEDNLPINVELVTRSDFRRMVEGQLGGGITHSFISKGRILYTSDPSLIDFIEENKKPGINDLQRAIFHMSSELILYSQKAEKWLTVKDDITYSRFYILKAAEVVARMEVCRNGEVPTREAVLQAEKFNPELMETFYRRPMAGPIDKEGLYRLVEELYIYLSGYVDVMTAVLAEYMGDGEIKTVTQIAKYYGGGTHGIIKTLEFLAGKGKIDKLSQTIRITPKSRMAVEDTAYIMQK